MGRTTSWTRTFPSFPLISQRCASISHGCALSDIRRLGGVSPYQIGLVRADNGRSLAKKRTVRPLKPIYSSDQEHEQDADTTLVDSPFMPASLISSTECPRQLRHVCHSVEDFWKKIEEEQDDTPLDIKHLVLDLNDTGVRLFVSPRSSWPSIRLILLLRPVYKS